MMRPAQWAFHVPTVSARPQFGGFLNMVLKIGLLLAFLELAKGVINSEAAARYRPLEMPGF